jgi:hypothetical protein
MIMISIIIVITADGGLPSYLPSAPPGEFYGSSASGDVQQRLGYKFELLRWKMRGYY